jgi:hypothetical protein
VLSELPVLPSDAWEPSKAEMDEGLGTLIARRAQLLFVFTGGARDQFNYPGQFHDMFPRHAKSPCVRVEHFADADHTFSAEAAKLALLSRISGWLEDQGWSGKHAGTAPAHEARAPQREALFGPMVG